MHMRRSKNKIIDGILKRPCNVCYEWKCVSEFYVSKIKTSVGKNFDSKGQRVKKRSSSCKSCDNKRAVHNHL